jgi:hypothetical protein
MAKDNYLVLYDHTHSHVCFGLARADTTFWLLSQFHSHLLFILIYYLWTMEDLHGCRVASCNMLTHLLRGPLRLRSQDIETQIGWQLCLLCPCWMLTCEKALSSRNFLGMIKLVLNWAFASIIVAQCHSSLPLYIFKFQLTSCDEVHMRLTDDFFGHQGL